jgi:hypothetical protein
MGTAVHRNTDSRACGAQTIVKGQANVYVNNLLASVQGDPNSHRGGALSASVNDGTVFINNRKVVLKGSSAAPDLACAPAGPPHCNPVSVGASTNVFACGGGGGGAGTFTGSPDETVADPKGSNLYPDPSTTDVAKSKEIAQARANADDPSSGGDYNTGPVGAPAATFEGREQQAYEYYRSLGYTNAQAAGIVGNLTHESKLNPGALNPGDGTDGTDSIGIAQWNSGRAQNLKAFAANRGTAYNDFETQLAFVDHELHTTEHVAKRHLDAATTPSSAAVAMSRFERYRGYKLGLQGAETQRRAASADRISGNN